jgi:hypothetical protein
LRAHTQKIKPFSAAVCKNRIYSLFVWLVLVCSERKVCWLVADGWFVPREKYCLLVADKPSEQAVNCLNIEQLMSVKHMKLH